MDTAIKFLVIAFVVATVAFAVIREGINYLEYPSLQTIPFPADGRELILYHRGTAKRQATLFVRELDPQASPQRIATLNYDASEASDIRRASNSEPLLGTLSWTFDHTALVASTRASRLELDPPPLWIFDVGSRTLYAHGQERSGQRIQKKHLEAILKVKGGTGPAIVRWYEMGKKENYVFSWKAHHWNKLSNPSPGLPSTSPPNHGENPFLQPENTGPASQ